jgi:hypothetical protein
VSVKVKPGVAFNVIGPAGYQILTALKETSRLLGVDLVITSGSDGLHSGPFDPHKTGEAYDVRSHDFDNDMKAKVLETMLFVLGPDRFYGVIEDAGGANEHYHFQRRIGTRYTMEDFFNA